MALSDLAVKASKMVSDNSPLILTAIGVTGMLTTAYLTGKASFEAAAVLRSEKAHRSMKGDVKPLETRERIELLWKLYIPAAGSALMSATAIICANRIGTRRAAAVAAAYSLSERAMVEYSQKVVETVGKNKEQSIRDSVAQDRVREHPPTSEILITGDGQVLCHDAFSGRYFRSSMETLRRAQNDINYQILHSDYATITDFYNLISLDQTSISDDMGWNTDKQLELRFSSVLTEDNQPCLSFDFATVPIRRPWQFS